jgi:hypothetical protein
MKTIVSAILLLLALAGCANMEVGVQQQGTLPRGFSQPGSPFPYNSPGW